jgi:hypothetical protein
MENYCSVCFNEYNDIRETEFAIGRKVDSSIRDFRCRHHVIALVDLFVNESLSVPNNELVLIRIKEN